MRRTLASVLLLASSAAVASPVEAPVLGGTPTTDGQFPQTVSVTLGTALCTGTLIAPEWVLTAAHCVLPSEIKVTTQQAVTQLVRVHFHALRAYEGTAVTAIDTIPDPMFNPDALGSHDSGLIHLASKVTDIEPVKLNFDASKAKVGLTVTTVGYGINDTSTMASGVEYVVQQTSVSCSLVQGSNDNLLCFDQTAGLGTCNGDSGGPSFVTLDTGKLLQVAVTSFGDKTCQHAGADTRVDAEKAFIQKHAVGLVCDTNADCGSGHECFQNACMTAPFAPTGLGATCTDNTSCESGQCATSGNDSKCTMACTVGDKASCPGGFDCVDAGGPGVCWPKPDGGCSAGGGRAPTWLLGVGLLGLVLRRRRRRAS